MKHAKWLGFLIVVFGILVFGSGASAAELTDEQTPAEEFELQFDMLAGPSQTATYEKKNGEEVTITVERVDNIKKTKPAKGDIIAYGSTYYLPFGTTKYKVSANSFNNGMSFYVDVYVPSNVSYSKILRAYDKDHWVVGGYMYEHVLTFGDKSAKYSANVSWMGGLGGASNYVKATLSGNVITTTASL